jgi:hypothetical protein
MEICQEHIGGESIAATLVAAGRSILAAVCLSLLGAASCFSWREDPP